MKNINTYIIEKLRINKDTKVENVKELLERIENCVGLNFSHTEISKVIKKWVTDNDVSEVSFYMTNESKDILISQYNVPEECFKEIIIDDKETEKLKNQDKECLFKNPNDPTLVYGNKEVLGIYSVDNYIIVKKER